MRLIFGLGIISFSAFAAAGTPDPGTDDDYPWLWWGEHRLESFEAAAQSAYGYTVAMTVVDTKAMRKVKPGESLFWVCQSASAAGAPVTLIDFGQTRVLIGT